MSLTDLFSRIEMGIDMDGTALQSVLRTLNMTENEFNIGREVLILLGRGPTRYPNGSQRSAFFETAFGHFAAVPGIEPVFIPPSGDSAHAGIRGPLKRVRPGAQNPKFRLELLQGFLDIFAGDIPEIMRLDHPDCPAVVSFSGLGPRITMGIDRGRWEVMSSWFDRWLPEW